MKYSKLLAVIELLLERSAQMPVNGLEEARVPRPEQERLPAEWIPIAMSRVVSRCSRASQLKSLLLRARPPGPL